MTELINSKASGAQSQAGEARSNQNKMIALIKALSGQANILTIPRLYISLTGDLKAALLLSQLVYWSDRTTRFDGFCWKTYEDWESELGLSKFEVNRARKALCEKGLKKGLKKGLVEFKIKRAQQRSGKVAPTCHYKVNLDRLSELLGELLVKTSENQETLLSEKPENADSDREENADSLTDTPIRLPKISLPADAGSGSISSSTSLEEEKRANKDVLSHLSGAFMKMTGLTPLYETKAEKKKANKQWRDPLWSMYLTAKRDLDLTKNLMGKAVTHMRDNRLIFFAPQSIEKVFTSKYSEHKTGGPR